MKSILACLLVAAIFVGLASAAGKNYTSKYDNVNVENVLNNDRVLTNYIKCLMGDGSCTPEGRELKKLLPDALQSDCSKCSDVQKRNSQKVITFLRSRRPGDWKLLLEKYDPNGTYRAKHNL
ncbi:pherokine 3 [Haematobia irritans]|uniref:pherokine 3 n=1 Tax=Haematobia irritans TaxID=7368 RepID=UPI003F4F7F4D